jgi:DNA-binding Lrp family transcriptional regulator
MDTTDILLAMTLLGNSRLPYSKLADKLNLSVNAVHRRVQALTESGIISAFTAKVSLLAVHAVHVMVFGQSEIRHLDEALKRLDAHDCHKGVSNIHVKKGSEYNNYKLRISTV